MDALLARLMPPLGIGALLAIAMLSAGLALTRGKLADARKDLRVEKAMHETDVANFAAAQARADADHLAAIGAMADHFGRIREDAERKMAAVDADWRARVLRLPAAAADPDRAGDADMPGAGAAPAPDGPGGDSILLGRADALICATNTARLQAAREWALDLASQPEITR